MSSRLSPSPVCLWIIHYHNRCSENSDCISGWCEGFGSLCSGVCKPKRETGQKSFSGYDDSCLSGKSSSIVECTQCQDDNGKIPNSPHTHPWSHATNVCQGHTQCVSGFFQDHTYDCNGRCKPPRQDGVACHTDQRSSCSTSHCFCNICGLRHNQGKKCANNDNCDSGLFCHNQDNAGNRCVGTCQPKLATGGDCRNDNDYSCISGKCRGCIALPSLEMEPTVQKVQ